MSQLNIFKKQTKPKYHTITGGEYLYDPNHFTLDESSTYYEQLFQEVEWRQEEMQLYGKRVKFPRMTAWYGENDKKYSFSGITLHPIKWTKTMLDIKRSIESKYDVHFNSLLLNLYRGGADSISWHTDAEPELGTNPTIASISFGAQRTFQLKHNETNERINLKLEDGSLLLMRGSLQHHWKHQIPKTTKPLGGRINLTFRNII